MITIGILSVYFYFQPGIPLVINSENRTDIISVQNQQKHASSKLFTQLQTASQFVKSHGYQIMMDSGANFNLKLPDFFDEIKNDIEIGALLKNRNEISKQNGMDFSAYLGKQVTLITYGVKNKKGEEKNFDILMDGDKIIGFWVDDHQPPDFNVIVNTCLN